MSARNFLPLCGTEGIYGTCHDEFDKFRITLLYNPLRGVYTIYCLDLVNSPKADLHLRDINVDPDFPPDRRLLAWSFLMEVDLCPLMMKTTVTFPMTEAAVRCFKLGLN
jgi:hypothetical protein